jgi:hypothetical protein
MIFQIIKLSNNKSKFGDKGSDLHWLQPSAIKKPLPIYKE